MRHIALLPLLLATLTLGCEARLNSALNGEFNLEDAGADAPVDAPDAAQDALEDTRAQDTSDDAQTDTVEDQTLPVDMSDAAADVPDMPPPPAYLSAGCGGTQGLTEGEQTFQLDGLERRYVVRLPENYDQSRPWPLVLALHGNGGSPSYWDATSGARNIREVLKRDAVLIIPAAIDKQWKDYSLSDQEVRVRLEQELVYFDHIIERAKNDLCINTDALFSMGFSGGGSYSGVLSCRRTDIRAIAVGGSVVYFNEDNCVGKSAAWIAISEGDFSSGRERYLNFFRDRVNCQPDSDPVAPEDCVSYKSCDADHPVHYCAHPGGHKWPDFGAQAMWDFFSTFVAP